MVVRPLRRRRAPGFELRALQAVRL